MADSFILRFCQNDIGTNLLTQAEYLADAQRLTGNQPGTARSKLVNKMMKQGALVSSAMAAWVAQKQATDVVDTLTEIELRDLYQLALVSVIQAEISAAQVVQPGTMMWWPSTILPSGWIKRNGAAINRTTYAALFSVLGTTFGAGDGSTTFNLMDDRAIFLRGWDDSRGVDVGRVFGSTQASANLSHSHTGSTDAAGSHTHSLSRSISGGGSGAKVSTIIEAIDSGVFVTDAAGSHSHAITMNSSGGTESRPFNRAYLPIIKI